MAGLSRMASGHKTTKKKVYVVSAQSHTSWPRKEVLWLFGGPPQRWRPFHHRLNYPVTQFKGGRCRQNYWNGPFIIKSTERFNGSFVLLRILRSRQLDPSLQGSPSLGRAISVRGYPFGGASLYSMPLLPQGSPSFCSFMMISPVGQYIWTLSHSFAWLRLGIGYRGYALIFRFCRMVGHHDFLVQSLLRPHDLISPLWWSGVEALVDNQPAVTQPLLLGSGFDVHPYRRINYLYHAAGRIPWWFCLANPSTFMECRLFTW